MLERVLRFKVEILVHDADVNTCMSLVEREPEAHRNARAAKIIGISPVYLIGISPPSHHHQHFDYFSHPQHFWTRYWPHK
jgi:hypothetical protein